VGGEGPLLREEELVRTIPAYVFRSTHGQWAVRSIKTEEVLMDGFSTPEAAMRWAVAHNCELVLGDWR
jgi:hypothetical protein